MTKTERQKKEVLKRIQKEALAHYDRMITWVERSIRHTPAFGRQQPSFAMIEDAIREDYSSEYCPYCQSYGPDVSCSRPRKGLCPLFDVKKPIINVCCCGGLYVKMYHAKTWKTWAVRAHKVRAYIKQYGGKPKTRNI